MSGQILQESVSYDGAEVYVNESGDDNELEGCLDDEDDGLDKLMLEGWINLWGDKEVKKKVLREGEEGTKPGNGYLCKVNIVGCLDDGTIFDEHEPLAIQVGEVEMVVGIDILLVSMNVGEKSLVEICPSLGYGTLGRKPDIPPNEQLIYLLELIEAIPEPNVSTYATHELRAIGIRKRERGNWWYSRNELDIALRCYKRSLDYLGHQRQSSTVGVNQVDALLEDRLKVYNNIAATQMKVKNYQVALEAIDYVVTCQPKNVKALFRKGKTLAALGDLPNALQVLTRASELEPENNAVKTEVVAITEKLRAEKQESKMLYKKMMGNENENGKVSAPPGQTKSKTNISTNSINRRSKYSSGWALVTVATVGIVLAGLVAYRFKNNSD